MALSPVVSTCQLGVNCPTLPTPMLDQAEVVERSAPLLAAIRAFVNCAGMRETV